MKKTIFYIYFLLFTTTFLSQNSKYFRATYNIYYNTELQQFKEGELIVDVNNNRTIFHIKKKDIEKKASKLTNGNLSDFTVKYKDVNRFIQMEFEQSRIYSKETHRDKIYYVKDTILKIKWNTNYTDEKKIGSLICKKATGQFRGRNYEAWYTTKIPIRFGPYKFHGLPGLIVSISDYTNTFVWNISSYSFTSEISNFKNPKDLKPIISAKKYFTDIRYKVFDQNEKSRMQSKLPKGIKLVSVTTDANIRKGIETKFEWEEY